MGKKSDKVKRWRENTKNRMIESMGGKCQCCGYKKCSAAMDFHHIDMNKKEIGLGKMLSNPTSWDKIVAELRKCVLVCNRCHQEIHAGARELPEDYENFNNEYEFKEVEEKEKTYCPVCKKEKKHYNKTCSLNCAAKLSRKVDWDSVNLKMLLKKHNWNYTHVGDYLDITGNAVKKRAKKLGLI